MTIFTCSLWSAWSPDLMTMRQVALKSNNKESKENKREKNGSKLPLDYQHVQ